MNKQQLKKQIKLKDEAELWKATVDNYNYELIHHEAAEDCNQIRNPEYAVRQQHLFYFYTVLCKYIRDHFDKNFSDQFGIGNQYTFEDLPETRPSTKPNNRFAFPFNDKFRADLLKIEKYKLTKTQVVFKNGREYRSTYYVGKYHNQVVLFREYNSIAKDPNEFSSNYSLSLVVQGKQNGEMLLIRYDHSPQRLHPNRLSQKNIIKEKVSRPIPETIPGHIHYSTMMFNIMFPGYSIACDCAEVTTNKCYEEMVEFFKTSYHINDNLPIVTSTNVPIVKNAFAKFICMQNEQKGICDNERISN